MCQYLEMGFIMPDERQILRELAGAYSVIAHDTHNAERIKLHKASNSLCMIRPVVLIDELPWSELNFNGELTLKCIDPVLRDIELYMRRELYKFRYLRADMIVRPYIPIKKIIHSTGIGLTVEEKTISTNAEREIVSHKYFDQLSRIEDVEKFQFSKIRYDSEETDRHYQKVGEIIGDIIPVKKVGLDHVSIGPWDTITQLRGVTPILVDLLENPELCHAMVSKLTDIMMDINEQYLHLGLFDNDPWSLHCTPIMCDELYPDDFTGSHKDFQTIWGRGAAQLFGAVSKEIHYEFDIMYMIDTIGRCGLTYYGCCEPLDKRIDIVEKIPNLRKISITPWADIQIASEVIGKKYVVASKPNPANVGVSVLNEEALRNEIGKIINACKKNNCSFDIVLKDISTCGNRPQNIFDWEKIVMEMVCNC